MNEIIRNSRKDDLKCAHYFKGAVYCNLNRAISLTPCYNGEVFLDWPRAFGRVALKEDIDLEFVAEWLSKEFKGLVFKVQTAETYSTLIMYGRIKMNESMFYCMNSFCM